MPTYRAYRVDRRRRIHAAEWIAAENDDAARAEAQGMCEDGGPVIELWQGGRRIEEIDCDLDEEPNA